MVRKTEKKNRRLINKKVQRANGKALRFKLGKILSDEASVMENRRRNRNGD